MPPPPCHDYDAADLDIRQIGCMSGLLQMFDQQPRRQLSTPRRSTEGMSPLLEISRAEYAHSLPRSEYDHVQSNTKSARLTPATQNDRTNAMAAATFLASQQFIRAQARGRDEWDEIDPSDRIAFVKGDMTNAYFPQTMRLYNAGRGSKAIQDMGEREMMETGWGIERMDGSNTADADGWGDESLDCSMTMMMGEKTRWTEGESMEEWKESLRAMARRGGRREGYQAPRGSPREQGGGGGGGGGRASSFDYKEAARLAQRAAAVQETARRSWDEGDLPRSIAQLRSRLHGHQISLLDQRHSQESKDETTTSLRRSMVNGYRVCSPARPLPPLRKPPAFSSSPPSPSRPAATNVVARLMGLDDLPSSPASDASCSDVYSPPPPPPAAKKPSSEAKLLQQLLQYTPPPSPASPAPPAERPPTANLLPVLPHSLDITVGRAPPDGSQLRSELQTVLKRLENLSLAADKHRSYASEPRHQSPALNKAIHPPPKACPDRHPTIKLKDSTPCTSPVRKFINEGVPVVVLKQCDDGCQFKSSSASSACDFEDEIEKRLRQLGMHSSEQERKTLKQILDAMQLKGLLKPPPKPSTHSPDAVFSDTLAPHRVIPTSHSLTDQKLDSSSNPAPRSVKATSNRRQPDANSAASIVIMKPLAKSAEQAGDQHHRSLVKSEMASRTSGTCSSRKVRNETQPVLIPDNPSTKSGKKSRPQSPNKPVTSQPAVPIETRKLSVKVKAPGVHDKKNECKTTMTSQSGESPINAAASYSSSRRNNARTGHSSRKSDSAGQPPNNASSSTSRVLPDSAIGDAAMSSGDTTAAAVAAVAVESCSESCPTNSSNGTIKVQDDGPTPEPHEEREHYDEEMTLRKPPGQVRTDQLPRGGVDQDGKVFPCDEAEQGSPVSVLEARLSDQEVEEAALIADVLQGRSSDHEKDMLQPEATAAAAVIQTKAAAAAIEMEDVMCDRRAHVGGVKQQETRVPERSVEYVYIQQVLEKAELIGEPGAVAGAWLHAGCKLRPGVYEELEEEWEAVQEAEGGSGGRGDKGRAELDRDMGGELYRRSRQAAMRRRLLFDCAEAAVGRRLCWWAEGLGGAAGRAIFAEDVWEEVRRMEAARPSSSSSSLSSRSNDNKSSEDSLYAILEQDLSREDLLACWRRLPLSSPQHYSLALDLEDAILHSLLHDLSSELSLL